MFGKGQAIHYQAVPTKEDILHGVIVNSHKSAIPESISILINFGYNDDYILFAAENAKHGCNQQQLWDSWSKVCRDIYCVADLVLTDFQCKGTPNNITR